VRKIRPWEYTYRQCRFLVDHKSVPRTAECLFISLTNHVTFGSRCCGGLVAQGVAAVTLFTVLHASEGKVHGLAGGDTERWIHFGIGERIAFQRTLGGALGEAPIGVVGTDTRDNLRLDEPLVLVDGEAVRAAAHLRGVTRAGHVAAGVIVGGAVLEGVSAEASKFSSVNNCNEEKGLLAYSLPYSKPARPYSFSVQ
jgi:hypothetical protein